MIFQMKQKQKNPVMKCLSKTTGYQCTKCGDVSLVEFQPGIKPFINIDCPNCLGKMILVKTE